MIRQDLKDSDGLSSKFVDHSSMRKGSEIRTYAKEIIASITDKFNQIGRPVRIMHVCGTHETTVAKSGIRSLLPEELEIISGPGCPVCICPAEHVSSAIQLARDGHIIVTFGDMFKVPDQKLVTLARAKSEGLDIRIVYSVSDAIKIARENPNRKVVWLGIGFETTAPMTAYTLMNNPPANYFVLADFRLVPPALDVLISDPNHNLDGFILPGHVSTIIGTEPYERFASQNKMPGVVGGFEPIDFLLAMDMMMQQILEKKPRIDNAYPQVVTKEGNQMALDALEEAFIIADAKWRGIGIIPKSGYELADKYKQHDAKSLLKEPIVLDNDLFKGCQCGSVIMGKIKPQECGHFLKRCTPETALGPCMVSDEGTCRIAALYQSKVIRWK